MRREVAALRAERAQVVLARELARRLCRQAAADERAAVVAPERPHFSALAICRWLFSAIIWGKNTFCICSQLLVRLVGVVARPPDSTPAEIQRRSSDPNQPVSTAQPNACEV
ncbi:uncharacterized protein LOC120659386 [Panicum virgatum]|uniref:uncharacterized protein LOC120659386 n=1 Tax=Panicum virgatum TaxID=38727 RepID=UPI0019D5FA89|nr:uncharacterized protein LOC120659386 [Panicum virgatum]